VVLDDFYGVENQDKSSQEPSAQDDLAPPTPKRLKLAEVTPEVVTQEPEKLTPNLNLEDTGDSLLIENTQHNEPDKEISQNNEIKIDFFTPSLQITDAPSIMEGLNIEIMQKPTQTEANLSEPSSEDESSQPLPVSSENSLLGTPVQNSKEDEDNFELTEEDEAALIELEKLIGASQPDSNSDSASQGSLCSNYEIKI